MKISTKFDVGDFVYFMHNNKIISHKIVKIEIGIYYDPVKKDLEVTNKYTVHELGTFSENRLFASKEELVSALVNEVLDIA